MAAQKQKFGRAAKAVPKKKHTLKSRISDMFTSAFGGKGKKKAPAKPAAKPKKK
jgi:hypothetical protein